MDLETIKWMLVPLVGVGGGTVAMCSAMYFSYLAMGTYLQHKAWKAYYKGTINGQMEMFQPPKLWEMYKQNLKM